jgi:glycosyltransferase involved in cell wall biosynthesis
LRRTLDTFTRLDRRSGWELVVVNNNCTDDTDAVCAHFADRLPIRVLHEKRPGQSFARNLAVLEARGQYILWTDDDVLVEPSWASEHLSAFERFQADWVFGPSEPEWPGSPPSWYAPRFWGYFAALDYGQTAFLVAEERHHFYGLNFGGTREAHATLGGFRTEFGFKGKKGGIGEDIDMFQRAFRRGMRIAYTPTARVRHVIPVDRVAKHYHRRRQWVAQPVYYQHLNELFPNVPWLLGLPRFFFSKFANDLKGYVRSLFTRDHSERFHYELQLLRFLGLAGEATRHGFKHTTAIASPVEPGS